MIKCVVLYLEVKLCPKIVKSPKPKRIVVCLLVKLF